MRLPIIQKVHKNFTNKSQKFHKCFGAVPFSQHAGMIVKQQPVPWDAAPE
jgi:hypothetical protein